MASHLLLTKQNIGAASGPEQIRREWRDFQVWYTAMRDEEGKRRVYDDELTKSTERRNNTRPWRSNTLPAVQEERETARKLLIEGRVMSRAKEEWQKRLEKTGLRMEQWTDISVPEHAAVVATLWGGITAEKADDFSASESSSDETETDFDSESVTPTPSTSSRGPQLWTPPEIARTSDLPLPLPLPRVNGIPGSSGGTTKGGDKKLIAPRGPPFLTQRPKLQHTSKLVLPMRSTQASVGEEELTPKTLAPALEALQMGDAASDAWLKANVQHAPKRQSEGRESRKSWSDDDRTLLASSTDVTDDEFYEIDEEANLAAPVYQKVPLYEQWIPDQQTASKGDTTQTNVNSQSNTFSRTDTATVQPPQTKISNQLKTSKVFTKAYPASYTSIHSYKVTIPANPSNIQDFPADHNDALRKQIKEILMPRVIEAKEHLHKQLTEAQADTAKRDKFMKEHQDTLKDICRIADELYRDQLELERQQLQGISNGTAEHGSLESITKQSQPASDSTVHHQQKQQGGSNSKARYSSGSPDRSSPSANATKPPSPLTPPHTPQPGTRYIGPVLTDEEMKDEAAAFDAFILAARKCKISEFHRQAEMMEHELAERFHTQKYNKKETWEILTQHDQAMEELKKGKEQERKDLCEAERKRRMADIAARARERESDEEHDLPSQPSQRQRSDSFQQKRKEDEMVTQTRWRLARADSSVLLDNSRGQTSAERVTNIQSQSASNRQQSTGSAKVKLPGAQARAGQPPIERAESSSGLLFVAPVDSTTKGTGLDQTGLQTSHVDKITPLSPTIYLPKLYSDIEGDEDAEFPTSNPDTKVYKRVRFGPVQLDDSDVDSSDPGRPSNDLRLGTGSGPDVTWSRWTMPREWDNGEGTSKERSRETAMGLKQAKGERNIEIWHPPAEKEGKGKEKEVVPDGPAQSQQNVWHS